MFVSFICFFFHELWALDDVLNPMIQPIGKTFISTLLGARPLIFQFPFSSDGSYINFSFKKEKANLAGCGCEILLKQTCGTICCIAHSGPNSSASRFKLLAAASRME